MILKIKRSTMRNTYARMAKLMTDRTIKSRRPHFVWLHSKDAPCGIYPSTQFPLEGTCNLETSRLFKQDVRRWASFCMAEDKCVCRGRMWSKCYCLGCQGASFVAKVEHKSACWPSVSLSGRTAPRLRQRTLHHTYQASRQR